MQKKPQHSQRLVALDGLRGIAILLVFLSHIPSTPLLSTLPSFLTIFITPFFSSGVTGVTILFALCGFLMAYLYHEPYRFSDFVQKRYSRIFPLFLTMVTVRAMYANFPHLSWFIHLLLILFIALISYFIWMGIRKIKFSAFSKILFWIFFSIQIATAIFYVFIIMPSPAFFYTVLPHFLRESILWLVNSTLTFSFGTYMPLLDGVYWSLAGEILFYIIYPLVCIPLILHLKKRDIWIQIFFILTLIPFLLAVYNLSQHVLGLNLLRFQLFYYFVTGIVLGTLYRSRSVLIERIHTVFHLKFFPYVTILFLPFLLIFIYFVHQKIPQNVSPLVDILFAFPITMLLVFCLYKTSSLSKLLSRKWFVYLGNISYSLYLSHTSVIDTLRHIYEPKNGLTNILFICIGIPLSLFIAHILNYLLEKPYFKGSKKLISTENSNENKKVKQIAIVGSISLIFFLFIAYQSRFNSASKEHIYFQNSISMPVVKKNVSSISLLQNPEIILHFKSADTNLGIISFYIKADPVKKPLTDTLLFKIKEEGTTDWYYTTTIKTWDIGDQPNYIIGFPIIIDSKGKNYIVQLDLQNISQKQSIQLITVDSTLKAIHIMNKRDFLKHPETIFEVVFLRIINVVQNKHFQYDALLNIPISIAMVLIIRRKSSSN